MTTSNRAQFDRLLRQMRDTLRDVISRRNYPAVLIPFVLLRRLDCTLAASLSREEERFGGQSEHVRGGVPKTSLEHLLSFPHQLKANLRHYIDEQERPLQDVLALLDMQRTIDTLDSASLLFDVVAAFSRLDLAPSRVSNHELGVFFEEVLRSSSGKSDDFGAYYTPRDVVQLISALVVAFDADRGEPGNCRSIYDCCCGIGSLLIGVGEGMLQCDPHRQISLFGQEVDRAPYAICRAELLLRQEEGLKGDVRLGNTLSVDCFQGERFDYMVANPPFGVSWNGVQASVRREAQRGLEGRFAAGVPRVSDGQLLFLQHLLAHMKPAEEGGSVILLITNGSPLFNGGAGSGESNIRRFVLEHDLLLAILALPRELFSHTAIQTYLWVLTNRKAPQHREGVQVIDATAQYQSLRRNQGEKRRELSLADITALTDLVRSGAEVEHTLRCAPTSFGYREIVVERPLRLTFQITSERLARLARHPVFQKQQHSLPASPLTVEQAEARGTQLRSRLQGILEILACLPEKCYSNRAVFLNAVHAAAHTRGIRLLPQELEAVLCCLGERDAAAEPCRDALGKLEADQELRDREQVPLGESIEAFFDREVLPFVPDAWINDAYRDALDGGVGVVGYEINVNRLFYRYHPPRPLDVIMAEIIELEHTCQRQMHEILGGGMESRKNLEGGEGDGRGQYS